MAVRMDDLPHRLRKNAWWLVGEASSVCREAADEIERLRARVAELEEQADHEWAYGDKERAARNTD